MPGEAYDADAETPAQVKLLVPSAFRGYVPTRHSALRYGLSLHDHGYFARPQLFKANWVAFANFARA